MPDLRISGASANPRSESDIRLNYGDPNLVLAAANDLSASTQPQFISTDGGATWTTVSLPARPGDIAQSDPEVDWTSDGTAWTLTMGVMSATQFQIIAYSSTDQGATWTLDGTVSAAQTAADREIIWVDHSPTSPFKDQIYAVWHNGTPVFFSRRTAGPGGTWSAPLQLSGAETTVIGIGADVRTNANGDVFVFWPDADGSQNIVFVRSVDGGTTFSAPQVIATTFATTRRLAIPAGSARRLRVYISAGAYRTATKDMVYAVWTDLSGEAGCTTGGGPGTNTASPCKTRVWFIRSTDGGTTWSAPVMINNQAGLNDQFHSRLCVDETNGLIVVTYRDTVADAGRQESHTYYQTSSDDGVSWSSAVQITTAPSDATGAAVDPNGFGYGDYDGLSGNAGTFFPCWTDFRNGVEEIWSARLCLTPERAACPAIAVNLENGLDFGTVCEGPSYLTLQVFNVGAKDLVITSVGRLLGSTGVTVLPNPGTPVVIAPGEELDFTIAFTPTTPGTTETATIRIVSNDPDAPTVDLMATAVSGAPSLEVAVPDSGDFGDVCLGSFVDRDMVLNNSGSCPLRVTGVGSSSPDFIPPDVSFYPLLIESGDSIELPIRFRPQSLGPAAATLTISSDDPGGPFSFAVSGNAPPPRLVLSIADTGDFGEVCVGAFRDLPLTISNGGRCALTVTGIASSDPEFVPPDVAAYPVVVEAGDDATLQIRFAPTSFGPKSATLTIQSDDPAGPATIAVSGVAPPPELRVTGSGHFGPVELGRRGERSIAVCNVGKCDLHVTRVAFRPDPWRPGCHDCDGCGRGSRCGCGCRSGDEPENGKGNGPGRPCDQCCATFTIAGNPFPATVRPGSCLSVLVRFTPTCGGPKCCELVIESDDPSDPEHVLYVTGRLRRTLRSALKCWVAAELQDLLEAGDDC